MSADLDLTVCPFILRGVSLIGIDSAKCPLSRSKQVCESLAGLYRFEQLDHLAEVITLNKLNGQARVNACRRAEWQSCRQPPAE